MAPYQAFPISNFQIGQMTARDPWLLPEEAFPVISNGFVRGGILQKRQGYIPFGQMVHLFTDDSTDTSVFFNHTAENIPVRPGTIVVTDSSTSGPHIPMVVTDDGNGEFIGDIQINGGGAVDYTTGVMNFTWESTPVLPITVQYVAPSFLPVMGITNPELKAGGSTLLAFDTKRINVWNESNQEFDDLTNADRYTGDDSNFFNWATWAGILYITNNINQLDMYDGTTLAPVVVKLDGETEISFTCLLVFAYKDHLVTLRTTEAGTLFAQRARWATAGGRDFSNDGFVDAPVSEDIKGGAFLGDDLVVVFENSIWLLKHTPNVNLPFIWKKVDAFNGTAATQSVLPFSSQVEFVGLAKIISTNGNTAKIENFRVPQAVELFNQTKFALIYSIFLDELDLQLISYAKIDSDFNDQMLVRNKLNGAWSHFDLGFHSFGKYIIDNDSTWDNFTEETWEVMDRIWDEDTVQAGFPIVLAGNSTGSVFQLNNTISDNGVTVPFEALSKELNPYIANGQKARLGWIDILVDNDQHTQLIIDLFVNTDTFSYKTETLSLIGENANEDKIWLKIYSGVIGKFHQIKLSTSELSDFPLIHSIVPYFQPVGGKIISKTV